VIHHIENPQQLADIFQTELHGLMAAFGNAVRLTVEPLEGVTVVDVLNDFDKTHEGQLKLPNLIAGMPILVVVRVNVPPMSQERDLCRFRLAWDAPKQAGRQQVTMTLRLPAVTASAWESLAASVEVQERAALLAIARFKKEATHCLERGDQEAARRWLNEARQVLAGVPRTPETEREAEALAQIEAYMESGEWMKFYKHAKYQTRQRRHSKPYP
jgi:Ca-activated chloride channel homolog